MDENTGPVVKHTAWESVVWHLKSRKSRLALAAVLTIILANCKWIQVNLGIAPEAASSVATHIVIVMAILVGAISGEKILNGKNGNDKIDLGTIKEPYQEAREGYRRYAQETGRGHLVLCR